jgi:hypothetical protein
MQLHAETFFNKPQVQAINCSETDSIRFRNETGSVELLQKYMVTKQRMTTIS